MDPVKLNSITLNEEKMKVLNTNIFDIPKISKQTNKTFAIKPTFSNRRIIAQKGQFTIHFNDKDIEQLFLEENSNGLAKIIINEDEMMTGIMLHKLRNIGFREDDIYQNLDSLSKRIIRENRNIYQKGVDLIPPGMF